MPLTPFQADLLAILAPARTPDSYLAGGTALHLEPDSLRFSDDFDLFHDASERVAEAYATDLALLGASGYRVEVLISQPGFIRALVSLGSEATRIDWARDSAWRFMPVRRDPAGGWVLHEVDIATNKVLALAGRDEPRDFVDTLYVMERMLPLGPLVWAASAKDPGFSPGSLLEQVRRGGRIRAEDVARLHLAASFDLHEAKRTWLAALADAEAFIEARPPEESGCLYYAPEKDRFVQPRPDSSLVEQGIVCHFGRIGGVLPRPADQALA